MNMEAIYARIPKVRGCKPECSDCCGPVPVMAAEAARIASPMLLQDSPFGKLTPTRPGCLTCAYSTPLGCSIYEVRPLICRLFGAVDHPNLTCPHGAKAKHPLNDAEATALINRAMGLAEEWKPAVGYEGRYEVSNLGRVRSLARTENSTLGPRPVKGCILRPNRDKDGYLQIYIRVSGKKRAVPVHRMVALAFHGDKRNELHREVAHLDNDRGNPRADNLKWVSKGENRFHRTVHGTEHRGEKHPLAKLKDADVVAIRQRLSGGERPFQIAPDFGVTDSCIRDIERGKNWRHLPAAAGAQRNQP